LGPYLSQLLRLWHTLRHLKPRQVAYQLYYRLTKRLSENGMKLSVVDEEAGFRFSPLAEGIPVAANQLPERYTEAGFCFLNKQLRFPSFSTIDWTFAEHGKLWTYNLNYFEFLRQPDLDPDVGEQLINSWVTSNSTHPDGWEPYPSSLRLINWLQFYRLVGREVPVRVLTSVRRQTISLWRKREFHLDGNHLLENALALAFVARCLKDDELRRKSDQLLKVQLERQYLQDGAHFELSVMYHLVLLWRTLDLYSLLADDTDELRLPLRTSLERQLGWAAGICTSDGRYPHFNDSTNGIAPKYKMVINYAQALGLAVTPQYPVASGYRRWTYGQTELWIDAAAIGPDFIPGHAHADNLTFVLHHDGQPFIVDTGISTYEKNARRAFERSTVAHNTVTVDGKNTSDVWGGFRVGQRSQTSIIEEQAGSRLTAVRWGYGGSHQRSFSRHESALIIIDKIPVGTARFHFDHTQQPEMTGAKQLRCGKVELAWDAGTAHLEPYEQAIGFNEIRSAQCLVIYFRDSLMTKIATS
jgi:hypothetical protein